HASVDALDDFHARVVAQFPIQLAVADVEGDDAGRAALKQDVGKPAGRGADVERAFAERIDVEDVERARELDAAAADIWMVRDLERDGRVGGDAGARLRDHLAVDANLTGHDERLRALAGGSEPAFDERDVEPYLFRRHDRRFTTHSAIGTSHPLSSAAARSVSRARSRHSAASVLD